MKLSIHGRATQTAAGTFEAGRVVVPTIGIGPLVMRDVVMGTGPFAVNEAPGVRVVGLLGFDFLDAATVNIDDAGGFVEAMRPGSLVAPTSATPVEIRLSSGAPVTRATPPYVVFQRFARAHPEAIRVTGDGQTSVGNGIGGAMSYRALAARKSPSARGRSTIPRASRRSLQTRWASITKTA